MATLMKFTKFALKNLFSKPVTKEYPAIPREYPERTRGSIQINIEDCIFCGSCQRKCPSGAITVDRNARTWSIDRMGCVQCENCKNGCPKNCLTTDVHYSEPDYKKRIDTYQGSAPAPKPEAPAKPKFTPEQIEEMKKATAAKKAAAAAKKEAEENN